MLLSELMGAIGDGPVRRRDSGGLDPDLSEVLLDDGATAIGPGKMVLAIREGEEQDLIERAESTGCQAIVVSSKTQVSTSSSVVVVLESGVAWTQLFVLLRTMLLASHDEAGGSTGPTSVHGLADAVAVMVGGSVVLYDRAHRVIAYSVQGYEIDYVRREAILGRRTPNQWVRRFTIDRTAYQTYAEPGRVVRVADYPDLFTRLRIAVHAGNEVIGEISVAEGGHPFPPEADAALRRAADLAVPVMLRHQRALDADRISRERAVRRVLWDGVGTLASDDPILTSPGLFVLGFALDWQSTEASTPSEELLSERFVHFLSLHSKAISPASLVAWIDGIYWALVPGGEPAVDFLGTSARVALNQLARMGVEANAAVGPFAAAFDEVPAVRLIVEDLLAVARSSGKTQQVMWAGASWAELTLLAARRGLDGASAVTDSPIAALVVHDSQNDTDLVNTLITYLNEFGSISASASRLYLHPNTMRHRIQRISEVSGLDLSDSKQRLAAALLLYNDSDEGSSEATL